MRRLDFLLLAGLACSLPLQAADPFAEIIRTTEAKTPEEQRKGFKVPDGFEVQLFASDPQITKPMNMAFDRKGRLWLTESTEYPFPVPKDKKARDTIKILEDTNGDGKADKITTFADGLNIPMGLYPYKNGVIAFSIPYVYYFEDTNGDDKADQRHILYGPYGYEKDTHGMTSGFRRGYDGWLYACHGFNNTTTLKGKDGSSITMNSGNTYRVRVDGSRVEQFTWGQVNPFGLTFDVWGNLYSADCHSLPIYQLIQGAHYPSFGKPHDGLGFAPPMMSHVHGSTAIGGIAQYTADQWPAEFRDNFFIGNVMTCRVNRDSLVQHGATFLAKEQPDFLVSDDPWFRPVDIQIGPDGAMYVADFYNRIIGHYEAPLTHPGRDRERGRIWRVSYKKGAAPEKFTLVNQPLHKVVEELGHSLAVRRRIALDEISDRFGPNAAEVLAANFKKDTNSLRRVNLLWALHRLDKMDEPSLQAAFTSPDAHVCAQAARIAGEQKNMSNDSELSLFEGLSDTNSFVVRYCAEALGKHPKRQHIKALLAALEATVKEDTHRAHTIKVALRNQLRAPGAYRNVKEISNSQPDTIADISLAVPNGEAAAFLLEYLEKTSRKPAELSAYLEHAVRHIQADQWDSIPRIVKAKYADDVDLQLNLFGSIQKGLDQRGGTPPAEVVKWGEQLATQALKTEQKGSWSNADVTSEVNPWFVQKRASADGDKESLFLSSLPGGEQLTGKLRSRQFSMPEKLQFYFAGHDGVPDKPLQSRNFIQVVEANGGKVLKTISPPRNDTAQKIEIGLPEVVGKPVYLEITDGDTGSGYAWLAAGRFSVEELKIGPVSPNQIEKRLTAAADLARTLKLIQLSGDLEQLLQNRGFAMGTRLAFAKSVSELSGPEPIIKVLNNQEENLGLREKLAEVVGRIDKPEAQNATIAFLKTASRRAQTPVALALAGTSNGAEMLLQAMEKGQVSPSILSSKRVTDGFASYKPLQQRVAVLKANLPPEDQQKQKLIEEKGKKLAGFKGTFSKGEAIYIQNCAPCHQLKGKGGMVAPQLDGVGNRGLERILEDVIDPNRHVDPAFLVENITLKDDQAITGLVRRSEGETLVIADSAGKEVTLKVGEIATRQKSKLSLMPDNFSDVIPPADFDELLSFLAAQK